MEPHIIYTAEELDALPSGSVVVDDRGVSRQKNHRDAIVDPLKWSDGGRAGLRSRDLADGWPMLVIRSGGGAPDAIRREPLVIDNESP